MTVRTPTPTPTHAQAGLRHLLVALCATALAFTLLPVPADAQEGGGVTPARVQGADRFDTAARIAGITFDQARVAVVVTGRDFPDALAGSFAAGRLNGPVLLVEPDHVPETTLLDGDRTAILATGEDFPDALSAGPVAARAQLPLLLTPQGGTMPVVTDALTQLGIERIVVVGGNAAVSDAVVQAYRNAGYAVERFAGPDRTATAADVADNAVTRLGFSPATVLLARGDEFPDALTASMHGAKLGAPILLARTPGILSESTADWLRDSCPGVDVVRALGGGAAIQQGTLAAAVTVAEQCIGAQVEIARFSTPLLGIPDRTHNLHLAADYLDGDVIASGTTYSLNHDGIGRRTQARGYRLVENGCIGAGGEAVDCVGGGVSQMGTTFLNVAWFAGIDLVEFRQHSLYFSRYPVCHEATLSWGSLDVVVHNNSPYDITIDTFYDEGIVGVRFLSQEWAQVQSFAEPQNPPGSGSFTSSCGRTITYPDGTSDTETYTWTYDGVGF